MFYLIGNETECTNQETTMLLQRDQNEKMGSSLCGHGCEPSMNSTLFLALRAVMKDRLHEW